MIAISIDIGTTKICAIAVDPDTGAVLEVLSETNEFQASDNPYEKIQDANRILEITRGFCVRLIERYAPILCIGITGQMHGIVYLNRLGEATGPLYTWQDQSGNISYKDQLTYGEYLSENSGYKMASGFGLTTCFYHTCTGRLPSDAFKLCTIHDYVAMRLTGRTTPLIHSSDAASFGLYDLSQAAFDHKTISRFGMDTGLLPEVTSDCSIIGETSEGIPVCVAIGDNQSSFLGSVDHAEGRILLNIGTGSQISVLADLNHVSLSGHLELRPYLDGKHLLTGSPLCGGRAYELLENFFRAVIRMVGMDEIGSVYPFMDALLSDTGKVEDPLQVSTRFSGTRSNPNERGTIENITFNNLTPASMMWGFLDGMAQELYELIKPILSCSSFNFTRLITAGNGVRKNPTMRSILSEKFGLPLKVPQHREEAAFGAALFAMTGVGRFSGFDEAQKLVQFVDDNE